ncbi:DUF1810 domain-containing protein [Lichenicola sp.]|uniref:DUF1810 domain-containing protein n=1 Tax=Lichenicola sp. TaxID=2804529 RepID=UPI003B00FE08
MAQPVDLDRFIQAQDPVFERVLEELGAGEKRSHWMWFVFPQLAGLGHSPMAQLYALASLEDARAYLAHPVLGARLIRCTELVNAVQGRSINRIMGSPDDMKLRSSMTLFTAAQSGVDPGSSPFQAVLDRYFEGRPDSLTLELLAG